MFVVAYICQWNLFVILEINLSFTFAFGREYTHLNVQFKSVLIFEMTKECVALFCVWKQKEFDRIIL